VPGRQDTRLQRGDVLNPARPAISPPVMAGLLMAAQIAAFGCARAVIDGEDGAPQGGNGGGGFGGRGGGGSSGTGGQSRDAAQPPRDTAGPGRDVGSGGLDQSQPGFDTGSSGPESSGPPEQLEACPMNMSACMMPPSPFVRCCEGGVVAQCICFGSWLCLPAGDGLTCTTK